MSEQPRVRGFGGVFVKAADPAALAAWYRRHLGIGMQGWNGAQFFWTRADSGERAYSVWAAFPADTGYFGPSAKDFMLNLRVDDLDGMLADLKAKGIEPLGRQDEDYGKFAWILDPDGLKVELWQQLGPAPE